jgi:O-antigen biosynthesis protein
MDVSVIIATRNRRDSLRRTLSALEKQTLTPHEVIVVDDGSNDGTGTMFAAEFPGAIYLRLDERRGPAAARNLGVRAATAELVAFTDDDCIPPPGWLQGHVAYYDDPRVGAVGGPQLPPVPNFYDQIEYVRYAGRFHSGVRRIERLVGWEGLATANMTVRRAIFDEVGYFDEALLTGADPEFSRRVVRDGRYALIVDPSLVVAHLKRHNLRSYLRTKFHRGCGAVLTDLKEGSLSWRRFLPLPNLPLLWREWRNFRQRFGGSLLDFLRFFALAILVRWVTVAGRTYYYWTAGGAYRRRLQQRGV